MEMIERVVLMIGVQYNRVKGPIHVNARSSRFRMREMKVLNTVINSVLLLPTCKGIHR